VTCGGHCVCENVRPALKTYERFFVSQKNLMND
jgi:hypothetical protein